MVIDYSFLMTDSSDSQCGCSDSQEPCEYQENEVVWAKIKGYPWWPGYVTNHTIRLDKQSQKEIASPSTKSTSSAKILSIVFCQQFTSSLLAFGNIRKFEPHFHDFFLVSKKNQRLKNSVLNAIELLKNNNEDISYFDKKTLARKIKKEPRTEGTPVKQNIKMVEEQMPQFNIIEPKIGVENVEKRKRGRPKKIVKQQKPPQQQQNQKHVQVKLVNNKTKSSSLISTQEKIPPIIIPQTKESTPTLSNIADYIVSFQKEENKMSNIEHQNIIAQQQSQNFISGDSIINKNKQSGNQKDVKIQQLNRLLVNKSFKKAFTLARTLKVNTNSVIDILNHNILAKMNHASNKKPYIRLKNRLKKALIDRYFNRNIENQFNNRKYHSHRGKTIRQIYHILRSTSTNVSKNLAIICEQKIHLKNTNKINEYKQDIITLINNLKKNELKNYMDVELSRLSKSDQ